jgi:hypothetical protein
MPACGEGSFTSFVVCNSVNSGRVTLISLGEMGTIVPPGLHMRISKIYK